VNGNESDKKEEKDEKMGIWVGGGFCATPKISGGKKTPLGKRFQESWELETKRGKKQLYKNIN